MSLPTESLAAELGLAEAADLARRGRHEAATAVLEQLDTLAGDSEPARLDLLARVRAQHGDLTGADAAWQAKLALRPEDRDALAGRALIAKITAGKRRRRPFPVLAVAAGVVLLLLAGGVVALVAGQDAEQPAAAQPAAGATAGPDSAELRRQLGDLEAERGRQREQAERDRQRATTLAGKLAAPGVRVQAGDTEVEVVFEDGLFQANGSEFTAAGRAELTRYGRRLASLPVTATVLGHGVAVPGGPATGGSAVAAARATAAAGLLARASGLPLSAFRTATAEQSAAPHPGSTPDDQARNRTVSLLLTPAGD